MYIKRRMRQSALVGIALNLGMGGSMAQEIDWAELAREDVLEAHEAMLKNHPGPVDELNPGFMKRAEEALEIALSLAERVEDARGHGAALSAYSAPFRDGHFGALPKHDAVAEVAGKAPPRTWPGFAVGWRKGEFKVTHSEQQVVPIGAELLSCDGRSASQLMRDDVFRFLRDKPDQEAYQAAQAWRLLVRGRNPFQRVYDSCQFTIDGKTVDVKLNWSELDKDTAKKYVTRDIFGERPENALREVRPGVFWVNLPNFLPRSDEEMAAIRAVTEALKERQAELRVAKAIVFDVHGNSGGNSLLGLNALKSVYGDKFVNFKATELGKSSSVHYRVSGENIAHLANIAAYLEDNGFDDYVDAYKGYVFDFARAAQRGEELWVQPKDESEEVPPADSPVGAKVYLLTDGDCASSCLDFADVMLGFGDVVHIGYPTRSDTTYLEVRLQELPSGYANVVLPIKVYRGRKRANREFYQPQHQYDGFDWSQQALENWFFESVWED